MADGAQRYGYGSRLQVLMSGGLQTASVIGPKECGRMLVKLLSEDRLMTVAPFGNGWIEEEQTLGTLLKHRADTATSTDRIK